MKNDDLNQLPKARTEQLIIKELPDETLVYDLASDEAHCLNRTAAMVWRNCDGEQSVGDITSALIDETSSPVDESLVWLALDQLEKFKLLSQVPKQPKVFAGMSRRQLMRSLGVAAIALPAVVSIIAPTPAAAVSCPTKTPTGGACSGGGNCCSGICCGSPGSPATPACPSGTCA